MQYIPLIQSDRVQANVGDIQRFDTRGVQYDILSQIGSGVIFFDTTLGKYRVSENGGPYVNLAGGSSTWDVLTNGNVASPELIFAGGDVVMLHF